MLQSLPYGFTTLGSLCRAAGMLVSGSRASALNGSASLFSLTCSQTLLDIQLTAPASNVCCPHKQWLQSGDSTIFCQRKQNAEVIGNICTPSSPVYVINSGIRECYGNWRKEEEKKCHTTCLILPYPSTLELVGFKFFENVILHFTSEALQALL